MIKIKYDLDLIKYMSFFESITGAKLKDCILSDGTLTFVVQEGQAGRAIGKNGSNIRKIEGALNKKVRVVEFDAGLMKFISNLIYPLEAELSEEEGVVMLRSRDTKTKALLIGRDSQNIRKTGEIVRRYFDVKKVKVV